MELKAARAGQIITTNYNLARQIHGLIVRPTLKKINLWSLSAEYLVMGTLLVESDCEHLIQTNGPALGLPQIEPKTYYDIIRYLRRADNKKLRERCLATCFYDMEPPETALIDNLRWAIIVARLKYYPDPEELPLSQDIEGLARYWKRIYNTPLGSGKESDFVRHLNDYLKSFTHNSQDVMPTPQH